MRALDIINMPQGLTAGQLASRLKLTTAAITGVLDRLERAGHARRTHDQEDRRRVVVQPTPEAKRFGSIVLPMSTSSAVVPRLTASFRRWTSRESCHRPKAPTARFGQC